MILNTCLECWEESMSFFPEYQAELHSILRATSQSPTPAALELPLRECYSVLNVSDVLESAVKSWTIENKSEHDKTNHLHVCPSKTSSQSDQSLR